MQYLICPDKFKGSLSSLEVAQAIQAGIRKFDSNAAIKLFPLADGGDGFSTVIQHYCNTKTLIVKTVDPLMRPLQASYEMDLPSKTAYIELAAASGLVLLREEERNPLYTSTYGTGLMIQDALEKGATKIVLGLGGSATNDGGIGILSALGWTLLNEEQSILNPVGKSLQHLSKLLPPENKINFQLVLACDVSNPLIGLNGAAHVYGAQKGAEPATIEILDKGLSHLGKLLQSIQPSFKPNEPGMGAAGGTPAALVALYQATIISGIEILLEMSALEKSISRESVLITGEGKFDDQSLQGKVVGSIAQLGSKHNIPVYVCCGISEFSKKEFSHLGIADVIQIKNKERSIEECLHSASEFIEKEIFDLVRLLD